MRGLTVLTAIEWCNHEILQSNIDDINLKLYLVQACKDNLW